MLVRLLTAADGGRLQRDLPPKPWRRIPACDRKDYDTLWAPLRSPWAAGEAILENRQRLQQAAAQDKQRREAVATRYVDDEAEASAVANAMSAPAHGGEHGGAFPSFPSNFGSGM